MRRRTFLKQTGIGLGAVAGVYSGALPQGLALDNHADAESSHHNTAGEGTGDEGRFTWGINAAVLKSPWKHAPGLNEILADRGHTLVLNRFFQVGGENRPVTPTECRVSYSAQSLFVSFRCTEHDMSFPYASLDPEWWHDANWRSLSGLPSGSPSGWPPYPDEVDILIQPDPAVRSYYQFAATLQGLRFGCIRVLSSSADIAPDQTGQPSSSPASIVPVNAFQVEVNKREDEWLVLFQIPWQTLGGKPGAHFGFLPMRTRWRDGEFTSPVALAIHESLPVDLLIETHFSGPARVENTGRMLCHLPSGALRWQRPALTTYPEVATCRRIWHMESSLATNTNAKNLPERIFLTERWMSLMRQEGFTTERRSSEVLAPDLTLAFLRQKMNFAFQEGNAKKAYGLLDAYLSKLDKTSRWWYADGSPGDILAEQWTPVTQATSLEVEGKMLLMHCVAGDHSVDLRLALPSSGGARIYGKAEGYWRPVDLLPLSAKVTPDSCSIATESGAVLVRKQPFSISFHDAAGREVTQLGPNALALRFHNDQILAIDFRHGLDPDEVIYGFGERYDNFNENGKVLTLWGTDGWYDHLWGPANTTYKPLPVFHSSKGYMAFNNSSYRLRADVGKTDPAQCRLTQLGPILDYYFWIGTPQQALRSYTALTGRPPLPPKWAFEPWMGRGGRAWASGRLQNAVAEEESVTKRFAELDIPHSAIYAEGPSALSPALNEFMAARGIRVLGYFMPAIGPSSQKALLPDVAPDKLPILHCGTTALTQALGYIDFSNPLAMELCRRALRPALDAGEVGSMVDFGDLTPDSARFHDGLGGAEMHNFYYYDYQRTISEVFKQKLGDDFILFARGAAPGTQAWVGQFPGDHPCTFTGLRNVLTGALNLCACGYSTWGGNLGGYVGFPQPAIFMRWCQFGCFSPLMRPHGTTPREPWYFGTEATKTYKFFAWTRKNILNYTYNSAATAHETGVSIMRSMAVSFPEQDDLAAISDQYMFGPDLLVAPVVHEDTFKTIAFPSGVWTSLWDGKTISGPAKAKVDAPLDTIPVYLSQGSAMPVRLNSRLQFGESMAVEQVEALVVTIPKELRKATLINARGEAAEVVAQTTRRSASWELRNLPEMDYLLLYGVNAASSVAVNAGVLPRLAAATPGSASTGWSVDLKSNRLIIRLPALQGESSDPRVSVKITF